MNVFLLSAVLNSNYARGYTNPLFSVRQVVIVCVCVCVCKCVEMCGICLKRRVSSSGVVLCEIDFTRRVGYSSVGSVIDILAVSIQYRD